MNILDFPQCKRSGERITMVTCYDFTMATVLAATEVDVLLVGDSAAMVMHGETTTLPIDVSRMAEHVRAVCRGAPDKLVVADMPFLSFRKGLGPAMDAVETLMQAGAGAVKIEGIRGHADVVGHIVESGVPVMGHVGLTPQSVHGLGGFRVQGRDDEDRRRLLDEASDCEAAGCFSLVLECIPERVAADITSSLRIPTIGIGAGRKTDGQVLVLHDLLGMTAEPRPRFVRAYLDGRGLVSDAVGRFVADVRSGDYPDAGERYGK